MSNDERSKGQQKQDAPNEFWTDSPSGEFVGGGSQRDTAGSAHTPLTSGASIVHPALPAIISSNGDGGQAAPAGSPTSTRQASVTSGDAQNQTPVVHASLTSNVQVQSGQLSHEQVQSRPLVAGQGSGEGGTAEGGRDQLSDRRAPGALTLQISAAEYDYIQRLVARDRDARDRILPWNGGQSPQASGGPNDTTILLSPDHVGLNHARPRASSQAFIGDPSPAFTGLKEVITIGDSAPNSPVV